MEVQIQKNEKMTVADQVESDIRRFLCECKNMDTGLRLLSKKSGLHSRTLQRLLEKKNKPSFQTLIKLYSVFFNTSDISALAQLAPDCITQEIHRLNPNREQTQIINVNIESELANDQLSLMIYALLGSGAMSEQEIEKKFGEYGLFTIQKLLALKAIEESPKKIFRLAQVQIHLTTELLAKISKLFIENYFRPEQAHFRNENYIGLLSESVNESTYQRILELDRKHFEEKIKLIDDPNNTGDQRIFSIQISEKI